MADAELLPIDLSASVSLRDLAYARLREAILEGRLAAGSRINERSLASTLRVSTTPIKDALRRLESDGLVVTLPRRGTYVSTLDPDETHELVVLRAALEGTAAKLAAERIIAGEQTEFDALLERMEAVTKSTQAGALVELNEAFHQEIHRLSRSSRIARLVESLRIHNRTTRNRILAQPDEMQRALEEHRHIAQTICDKNPEAAEAAMRAHVLRSAFFYEELAAGMNKAR
jgi:DNA-binding GntR family transcriptional regulator